MQYDTIKNEVKRIRDSVRVTNNYGEDPLIIVKSLKIIDSTYFGEKTYKVQYDIESQDAKSINLDLKFDVFAFTNNDLIRTLTRNSRVFYKGESIGKDKALNTTLTIPKDENYYISYIFRIKGNYYTSKNQSIYIDKFYILFPRKKVEFFGTPTQNFEDRLRAHLIKFQIN